MISSASKLNSTIKQIYIASLFFTIIGVVNYTTVVRASAGQVDDGVISVPNSGSIDGALAPPAGQSTDGGGIPLLPSNPSRNPQPVPAKPSGNNDSPTDDNGTGSPNAGGGAGNGDAPKTSKDPVYITSGNNLINEIDLVINCPFIDIVLQRTYLSADRDQVGFGQGWHHNYDWQCGVIERDDNINLPIHHCSTDFSPEDMYQIAIPENAELVTSTSVVMQALSAPLSGGGDFQWFEKKNNQYKSFVRKKMTDRTGGGWNVTLPGGIVREFAEDGRLIEVRHSSGQKVILIYDPTISIISPTGFKRPRLNRVEHSNGQYLDFVYSGKHIIRVNTADPNLYIEYSYNNVGDLVKVIRHTLGGDFVTLYSYQSRYVISAGRPSWGVSVSSHSTSTSSLSTGGGMYQPLHWLNARTNANGTAFLYTYKDDGGKTAFTVGVQASGGYYKHTLEYPASNHTRIIYDRGDRKQFIDYYFDPFTSLMRTVKGPNNTNWCTYYNWSSSHDLIQTRKEDKEKNKYWQTDTLFDINHNPTNIAYGYNTNAASQINIKWNTDRWEPIEIVDPEGVTVQIQYTNGLIKDIMLLNNTETYTGRFSYDNAGNLLSYTNANGIGSMFRYDNSSNLTNIITAAGIEIKLEHDILGHVSAIHMPGKNGTRTVTISNDDRGRPLQIVYPTGLSENFKYDAYGHLLEYTDAGGRTTRYDYVLGNLHSVTNILLGITNQVASISIDYDKQLNVLNIKDQLQRPVEQYNLDDADRIETVNNLEGQQLTIDYELGNLVNSIMRFDGTMVDFNYNNLGFVSEIAFPDTTNHYVWRKNGQIQSASNTNSTIVNSYNAAGRLTQTKVTSDIGISTNTYTYYPAGQVSNVTINGGTFNYTLDQADRLKRIDSPEGTFLWSYNSYNALVSTTKLSNAMINEYDFDDLDRLTSIQYSNPSGQVVRSWAYAYNHIGIITGITDQAGIEQKYRYDSLDRLTNETIISNAITNTTAITYDLAGNRLSTIVSSGNSIITNSYIYGTGNRLTAIITSGITNYYAKYNDAGCITNIMHDSDNLSLKWNSQYQLTSVSTNGAVAESYQYDSLGRRICSVRSQSGTTSTNYYIYDGIQCVADTDSSGNLLRSYTWGPGVDNLLAMTVYTGSVVRTYYALTDHLGTVHALTDSSGNIVESYKYDAWGRVLSIEDNLGNQLSESALGNRYLWQGREYSWSTGLYNFRARWYDPVTGRWLSKDPIGISGGLNQYVFVENNPVNARDPWGLLANVLSAGGEQIYYPHGGWNSVNVPAATFEQRNTSGFANVDRFTKPAQIAFAASGTIVAGGVVVYYGYPYVIAGGTTVITHWQDMMYKLAAWQPMSVLDQMILYYPQLPPTRATVAEAWYSFSPYASQFASGLQPGPGGPFGNWSEFGSWFSAYMLSGGESISANPYRQNK